MKKFKKRNDSGITLIGLIVTVIVLLILAGVSISTLTGDNGIISKTQGAKEKYSEAEQREIELLEEISSNIDYMQGTGYEELWTGTIVGHNGTATLPILLNDCSKKYVLTVESNSYKGPLLMNLYGFSGPSYVAYGAIGNNTAYSTELRQVFKISSSGASIIDSIEEVLITYNCDGTESTITYDNSALGSELRITKIATVKKEYSGFAGMLFNGFEKYLSFNEEMENGKFDGYTEEQIYDELYNLNFFMSFISTEDLMSTIEYCLTNGITGYQYLNKGYSETSEYYTDVDLEMRTLEDILANRSNDVETLKFTIIQQIQLLMYFNLATTQTIYTGYGDVKDPYTFMDFWQENEYLNDAYTRLIGNTFIPYTLLFADDLVTYLNEDGTLKDVFSSESSSLTYSDIPISIEAREYMFEIVSTGNSGWAIRLFADYYDSVYDIFEINGGDNSAFSQLELLKLTEAEKLFSGPNNELLTTLYFIYPTVWEKAFEVYYQKDMDVMYKALYDNGISINLASLRLGWNYVIQPIILGEETWELFDITKDTEYIRKAGLESMIDEICEYIDSVVVVEEESTGTETETTN